MKPIGIDLFAGAGGLSLGFEQAGFDVAAAVEIDPVHCAVHEYNFPHCEMICQSVDRVTGEEIKTRSQLGDREIDVLFGGPPCQGFSLMGKRLLDDPRNTLVFHFIRLIQELQPKYFVMENVKGMAIGKHQELIGEVIEKIEYYDYDVVLPYQVLNAANYGVPQSRERLFLIGARRGLPLPKYPQPLTKPAKSKRKRDRISDRLIDSPTVWDALQDLPNIEEYAELERRDWAIAELGTASPYAAKLRDSSIDPQDYSQPREYDRHHLTASGRTRHTPKSIGRFAATPPGKTEPISRFLKLDPDGVCNTLRAGTPSSRGAFTSPRPIHPHHPRCITVREAARLHSYPDWFRFHTTKWHGFRQIGNSVPPWLGRSVAGEIMKVLEVTPSKPIAHIPLGDTELLSLTMAQAARHYGVAADVIPQRSRQKEMTR
ncbi:MAG: DNA cytosine methyltransferase [Cyanobacteriota bacterium]|nr:DNA cytosine methyltransferase [Cyanobacteriota bacterium]